MNIAIKKCEHITEVQDGSYKHSDSMTYRLVLSLLLASAISACSGSDSENSETNNPPNDSTNNPDVTNPPADPVNLVSATTFPTTDDNGDVTWEFDAEPSELQVIVEPFVEMPLASNGSPARWNAMSSFNDRLFVVDEQDGRVYEISDNSATLWFDISNAVQAHTGRSIDINNPFHGGVRSIAFHPEFATNGKFYASLMEQRPTDTSAHRYLSDNSGISADSVLVEWTADTTSYVPDASSYREVFRVGVPQFDHPVKQITFNPGATAGDVDFGNLYIAHGDGSVASSLAGTGLANDALGKILRINPLENGTLRYTVPADNPFINDPSLPDEVYSYGHRNPHHLAFSASGSLLATEAGRDNIEEVNLIASGGNYGWSLREGAYVHLDGGTVSDGIAPLPDNDALNGFVYPAVQFGHNAPEGASFTGQALGGGYVVENGSALDGQFFYIDFPFSGELFYSSLTDILAAKTSGDPAALTNARSYRTNIRYDHDNNSETAALDNDLKQIVQSAPGYVNVDDRVDVRILQGSRGELYLSSKRNNMVYLVSNSLPE